MKAIPVLLVAILLAVGCQDAVPTQAETTAPSDHTVYQSGVAHKAGLRTPFAASSGCSASSCHQSDLRGGDGITITAPSCYSCHGKKWNDAAKTQPAG
jgi:hypothetical protein